MPDDTNKNKEIFMALTSDRFNGLNIALNTGSSALGFGYGVYQDQRNFNYQKELNETLMEREDNAVQRRVADLRAAGLSPTLAAGSAASSSSGSVASAVQPENKFDKILNNYITAEQIKAMQLDNAKTQAEITNMNIDGDVKRKSIEQMDSNIAINQAELALYGSKQELLTLDARKAEQTLVNMGITADNMLKEGLKLDEETRKILREINLISKQYDLMTQQGNYYGAQTKLIQAQEEFQSIKNETARELFSEQLKFETTKSSQAELEYNYARINGYTLPSGGSANILGLPLGTLNGIVRGVINGGY